MRAIHLFNVIFIICCSFRTSHAQDFIPAKWVSMDNDTIEGQIKAKIIDEKIISARINAGKTTLQLDADRVELILYNNQVIFRSSQIYYEGKVVHIFLELIQKGSADLYAGSCGNLGKLFFVGIGEDIRLIGKTRISEYLKSILGSCFDDSMIKKDLYTQETFTKVLNVYNECMNPGAKTKSNPADKFQTRIYSVAHVDYNNGNFKFERNDRYRRGNFSNISNLGGGLSARIELAPRVIVDTGLIDVKEVSRADSVPSPFDFQNFVLHDVVFDLNYLEWPICLGYFFKAGKAQPFLTAGIDQIFLISGSVYESKMRGPVSFDSYDVAFIGEAGVVIAIGKRSALQVAIRTIRSRSEIDEGNYLPNLKTKLFGSSIGYVWQLR